MIQNTIAENQLLGALYNNPELFDKQQSAQLKPNDFTNPLRQLIFKTLENMFDSGYNKITISKLETYLHSYPNSFEMYMHENQGRKYLEKLELTGDKDNYNYAIDLVKKYTLLRNLKSAGLNVDKYYNEAEIDQNKIEKQNLWVNKHSLSQISNILMTDVESAINDTVSSFGESYNVGEGIRDLVNKMQTIPDYGAPMPIKVLNEALRGMRLGTLYIYSAATGGGKLIDDNELVPTYKNGKVVFKKHGDLQIGDYVFNKHGEPVMVSYISPKRIVDYEVEFANGSKVKCNGDHLWTYHSDNWRDKNKWETTELNNLMDYEKITSTGRKEHKYSIPTNNAINLPEKEYSVHPYIIGAFIGDGCCKAMNLTISGKDKEIYTRIASLLGEDIIPIKAHEKNYSWEFCKEDNKLKTKDILGTFDEIYNKKSYEKTIPEEYLQGSIRQRWELIKGLFDTDGSTTKSGNRIRLDYSTTSKKLAEQIKYLLQTLGIESSIRIRSKKKQNHAKHDEYQVRVKCDNSIKGKFFFLSRKKEIASLKIFSNNRRNYDRTKIVNIRKLNADEISQGHCIMVEDPEHLYCVTKDFIVTHNTRTLVSIAASKAIGTRYDWNKKEWIKTAEPEPVTYIGTELQLAELQSIVLSFVSGISQDKIMKNKLNYEEAEILSQSIDIIEKSQLRLEIEPQYTLGKLEKIIKQYTREGCKYFFFDYIVATIELMEELKERAGMNLREDQILHMVSTSLKNLCTTYNIFIFSSTQLTSDSYDGELGVQSVRGSRALVDRADALIIGSRIRPVDKAKVEKMANEGGYEMPNYQLKIVKSRGTEMAAYTFYGQYNLGNMEYHNCFTVDPIGELVQTKEVDIIEKRSAF